MKTFRIVGLCVVAGLVGCGQGARTEANASEARQGGGDTIVIERARLQAFLDAASTCYALLSEQTERLGGRPPEQQYPAIESRGTAAGLAMLSGRLLGMTPQEVEARMVEITRGRPQNAQPIDWTAYNPEQDPACARMREPIHSNDRFPRSPLG